MTIGCRATFSVPIDKAGLTQPRYNSDAVSAAVATVYQDTDGVTMVGSAGYNACIGFKFAAFLAQSGKANALASSKLYVVVVHLSNVKRIKKILPPLSPGPIGLANQKKVAHVVHSAPEGLRKKGPAIRDGRQV